MPTLDRRSLLAEAVDRAKSPDRRKVAEQILAFDLRDGPGLLFPGHHVKYDQARRRMDAKLMIVQWQNGRIVTTGPPELAVATAIWPKGGDARMEPRRGFGWCESSARSAPG